MFVKSLNFFKMENTENTSGNGILLPDISYTNGYWGQIVGEMHNKWKLYFLRRNGEGKFENSIVILFILFMLCLFRVNGVE